MTGLKIYLRCIEPFTRASKVRLLFQESNLFTHLRIPDASED